MAQEGYDTLMNLTESRYRLSMVVARRAAQLKTGIPSLLSPDQLTEDGNMVTVAMKELELGLGVVWGDDLPAASQLRRMHEPTRRADQESSASAPLESASVPPRCPVSMTS